MKEFEYPSAGGGIIHAYRWEPKGNPVAIVQLIHGVAEHMGRYDEFAQYLASRGALVVGHDHMGHGASHGTLPLHFVGGWEAVIEDTCALLRQMKKEYPDLPYILFGHSMGSFVLRTILVTYPDLPICGAVICGTGRQPAALLTAAKGLTGLICLCGGKKWHSGFINSLMFGSYNKHFKPNRTPNDWINSDPAAADAYTADPLCGGNVTVGLARQMMRGIGIIQKKSNLQRMKKDLPVHFIAGKNDPVGEMGKGVTAVYETFRTAGMEHVTIQLYEGRHEILKEPNRTEIFEDVWKFVKKSC